MVVISIPATVSGRTPTSTIATCLDTNSIMMLEFQGAIEMDGQSWAGNTLGQLSILDGGVKAQLVIGNHRLDGKVMKLAKPLLLIQKQQKPTGNVAHDSDQAVSSKGKGKSKDYADMDEPNRRSSLSSIPPPSPPRHDDDDTMTSLPGEEYDSGAVRANESDLDPLAPSNIKDSVQYDTVAVIRQRILFNTMPVPIIHTERRGLTVIKRGV
ncbi:hypothetical protein BGZ70_007194 [Mortierella alpina]|uniref:Chromosome transmission fidelity protein 8 n=1 Tax=Mortierella alpina TaxID=64518 RepID=A0A9P6J6S0_MORAP|nr:hypothetical protein BGZ70_007194 [Mortierella alpina]